MVTTVQEQSWVDPGIHKFIHTILGILTYLSQSSLAGALGVRKRQAVG